LVCLPSSLNLLCLLEESMDYTPPCLIYEGPEESRGEDVRKRSRPPKSQKGKKVGYFQRPPAVSPSRNRTRKLEVITIQRGYQRHHPETTRNQVELIEDRIRQKMGQTPDSVKDEEVGRVIPNPGHSRG
jgi:hypothetical protein